ncbi:MAG: AhpC/TSA family protein, partial [Bacteroidetes bacterium]|nr:AhpC/TSA family protein [Bacteroidota bacterium]
MLRYAVVLLVAVSVISCGSDSKKSFTITGTIKNNNAKKIYLEET